MQLSQLLSSLGLTADKSFEVRGLNTLKDATSDEVSFLDNKKYAEDLKGTKAGAVFVSSENAEFVPVQTIAIITEEPYLHLAYATKFFAPKVVETEGNEAIVGENTLIQNGAFLGKGVVIGKNTIVMHGAFVGDYVRIGDNTIIYPNVTIYRDCSIGSNCIIHANSAIGSDGFGFAHTKMGEHIKIYQNGNVVIEDDVEIGSNTSVDRAVFGTTRIKKGSKIDNLVQIGHNCVIGEHTILAGQVGVSGSSILGRNVVMGGQSGTAGHLEIAPFTTIAARGGVTKNIEQKGTYAGFPLFEHREWLKLQGRIARLLNQ